MHTISPFATVFPEVPVIRGVQLAATNCGMRYAASRDDLLLVTFDEGTTVAGVFTKSSMAGMPIDWCKSILSHGQARALVVNAGISNVFTGEKGLNAVKRTAEITAELLGCKDQEIYIASTGIIGQHIKMECVEAHLPKLVSALSSKGWEKAAKAILTTDTFPKGVTRQAKIGDNIVTINGMTKGSGMIAPDMATMLAFVFTDAAIPADTLQAMLNEAVKDSYNAITVDSDTSTSDTLLIFATGKAGNKLDADLSDFKRALNEVLKEMAELVIRDGEGISKLIEVIVEGAKNDESAKRIALSIANSPLVKTAIAGGDANWGRIAMAIGKSGELAIREKTCIWVGDALIAKNGMLNPDYNEKPTAEYMKGNVIRLTSHVGVGEGKSRVLTCDLTHGYIDINADYRS